MSRKGQLSRLADIRMQRAFLSGLAAILILQPRLLCACAACYGQSDSPMAAGMNWGIMSLLGVIGLVLGGVASFFVYLARRGAKSALLASTVAAFSHRGSVPNLGLSDERKPWGLNTAQTAGRVGHLGTRTEGRPDTAVFGEGLRHIVPGSTQTKL
jgi:hypothetical protein